MNKRKKLLENRKRLDAIIAERHKINERRQVIADEHERVFETLTQASAILDQIDDTFERQTQLKRKDVLLLFSATALQVIRQVLFRGLVNSKSSRLDEKTAAKDEYGNHDIWNKIMEKKGWTSDNYDYVDRGTGYYHTTLEEIVTHPVPFDTQTNSGYGAFDINLLGENMGLGGGNFHRITTLGHDPILGLIFGTANIATRTATVSSLQSFHIRHGIPDNLKKNGESFKTPRDYFARRADTTKVLKYGLIDPIQSQNSQKIEILTCSLIEELIHLKSDVNSKQSLPLPFTTLTPELARNLSKHGIDMANVFSVTKMASKQASIAIAINTIISLVHTIIFDKKSDGDRELYQVRTRKILAYSDLLATSSNIIDVGVRATCPALGGALNSLDLGGVMVTIAELFRDIKFISKVKEEFIRKNWDQAVMGDFN